MAGGASPEKIKPFSRDPQGERADSACRPQQNLLLRHAPRGMRLAPFVLIAAFGLIFFGRLVLNPASTLYSKRSDLIAEHIPAKQFLVRSWHETGELPLWCPDQFGGEPFVHDMQVGVFYPPYWILLLLPPEATGPALSWLVVAHVIVAGWCMYALARSQGLGRLGATAAALCYMFAGKWMFHLLEAGHVILIGLAWLPLVLVLLDAAVRRRNVVWATAAGAAAALAVLGTHPQWTFYSALLAAGWTLGTALETAGWLGGEGHRTWRRTLAALGAWAGTGLWAALTAGALCAVQLLPTLEAATQSTRGAGVAPDNWLWEVAFTLFQLFGPAPALAMRWENRAGLGVVVLAAAVLAPVLRRGRVRWQAGLWLALWVLALGGGTLLADLGTPGFQTFRLHVRVLITAALPAALLVGVTTDALFGKAVATAPAWRTVGVGIVLGALAVSAILLAPEALLGPPAGATWRFPYYPVAAVFLVPAAGVLLVRRLRGYGLTRGPVAVLWMALLLFDLWAAAWPLVDVCDVSALYKPSPCVAALLDRKKAAPGDHWRVLDVGVGLAGHSALGSGCPLGPVCDLETIGGFNPLDVHRYRDYLQMAADRAETVRPFEAPFGQPILLCVPVRNKKLLDLLGVRYLLQARDAANWPKEHMPATEAAWRLVLEDDQARSYSFTVGGVCPLPPYEVWENPDVLPRAFMVPAAAPLPERPDVLDALKRTDFKQTVLLEGWRDEFAATAADAAYRPADVIDYRPNRVALHEDGPAGWLVLADVWFPGWTCTVNRKPADIHRADFLFRAVQIPGGPCDVVFTFEPESYRRGREWSLGAAALVFVLFLGAAVRGFLRTKRGPAAGKEVSPPPVSA